MVEGAFGKDSGARCVRNVLAAAACREVGGWMDGREGGRVGGVEVKQHSLQIIKELSSLQRSTVAFTSPRRAASASPFCLEGRRSCSYVQETQNYTSEYFHFLLLYTSTFQRGNVF